MGALLLAICYMENMFMLNIFLISYDSDYDDWGIKEKNFLWALPGCDLWKLFSTVLSINHWSLSVMTSHAH